MKKSPVQIFSTILLFWNGGPKKTPKYVVDVDSNYDIWDTISNGIRRVNRAQELQSNLGILKDPTRHLMFSRVSIASRSDTSHTVIGEGGLVVQRSRGLYDHRGIPE